MKKLLLIPVLLIVALSCNTSKITTSWQPQNTTPKEFSKIMVIGLIREADRSIREKMEAHFVGDLQSLGYKSVSALVEYGPKAFENLEENEEVVLRKIRNSGVDAVITIVLLDKEKERSYGPTRPYQNGFWGYYGRYNRRITEKDYYVINTRYFWESNLYDLSNGQLLYSVQTQSFDPASAESMGHEYGKMIVKDMEKKNVLQSRKK